MIPIIYTIAGFLLLFFIAIIIILPFLAVGIYLFAGLLLMLGRHLVALYEITIVNRCLMCDTRIFPFITYCSECNGINKVVSEVRRKNRANK